MRLKQSANTRDLKKWNRAQTHATSRSGTESKHTRPQEVVPIENEKWKMWRENVRTPRFQILNSIGIFFALFFLRSNIVKSGYNVCAEQNRLVDFSNSFRLQRRQPVGLRLTQSNFIRPQTLTVQLIIKLQ